MTTWEELFGTLSWGRVSHMSPLRQAALENNIEWTLKHEEIGANPKMKSFQLGSYCQNTGNCKKSVLPGMQGLGSGTLERHKYSRFLWALTHCYTNVHSLFFISLWYHCPSYIHKHRNRILFCSLTPFPSQSQEAHQETFIGCCYVSIRREQNMHFQPKMTYSRLRKNNSMKESKQSLQERAQYMLFSWNTGRNPKQSWLPLTQGILDDGKAQPKGNKRHNPSVTSHYILQGLDTMS